LRRRNGLQYALRTSNIECCARVLAVKHFYRLHPADDFEASYSDNLRDHQEQCELLFADTYVELGATLEKLFIRNSEPLLPVRDPLSNILVLKFAQLKYLHLDPRHIDTDHFCGFLQSHDQLRLVELGI
jgi:hypothetical protein